MITVPPGFDINVLVSDFDNIAAPLAGVMLLISVGFLITKILKRFGHRL